MTPRLTKLDNGLTVLTDPMPGLKSVALSLWVRAGSRDERAEENGMAHMLEHMAFKGTGSRDAQAIAEEIENVGGFPNAYTSESATVYHVRLLEEHLALGTEILSDIVLDPSFPPDELERERNVVLQEIGQCRDTPDDLVFENLMEIALPGQALGRSILGTPETVRGMTCEGLRTFRGRHYHGDNALLVAAGAVDHDALVTLAARHLGGLPARAQGQDRDAFAYGGGERRDRRDLEQAHVALAFPGASRGDPDWMTARLFAQILGGGMSSRLFQEIRERRGLAYSVFAEAQGFDDGGLILVYAGTDESDTGDLLPAIAGEMEKLGQGLAPGELDRAKAQLRAAVLIGTESAAARADHLAGQFVQHGRLVTPEEVIAKVDAVTEADIAGFAARLMATRAPSLSALGPISGLEAYDHFSARFGG
jgi:predicted Zn-dependent peptidase